MQRGTRAAATLRYIESSSLLAAILEGDPAARRSIRTTGRRVTSALTLTEAARALVRARVVGRLRPDEERGALQALQTFERRCDIVLVTDEILRRAGRPFPAEPVRTLDGVHLATIEALGEPPQLVTVVTRDARIRSNASALGYVVE